MREPNQIIRFSAVAMMAGTVTFGWSGIILAQWPSDPSVNLPICTATGDQTFPKLVSDDSDGAIIAWADRRSEDYDIYAQRVDASGVVQWAPNGVAVCTAVGRQYPPTIAADGSGGAVITWCDYRGPSYDVYAQRVNASGVAQWVPNGIRICAATGDRFGPTIVSDGSGGAIITWYDDRGWDWNIYAQRVDASGILQWAANGVGICTATGNESPPRIVADGSGGAVITWHDDRSGASDIYAQRVDGSGVVQWALNGVGICTATGYQEIPSIEAHGSGGATITWCDRRSGASDIYAQRVDASGAVQWTVNGVAICTAAGYQTRPAIVSDGSGGAVITWHDDRSGASDIYAQRVDASGVVQWALNGVTICTALGDQYHPKIVSDGSGGAIITWYDQRGLVYDVYAQRVDASGAVQWTPDDVAVCTATGDQYYPTIVSDGSGGAIITWYDQRGPKFDIYAQNVNSDGSLGIPAFTCLVTGGGWVPGEPHDPGDKRTFGFNVHSEAGLTWGQLQFNDHGTRMRVHSDTINTLVVQPGDTVANFSGDCRLDGVSGYSFECEVMDRGEPGHGVDKFSLNIYDADGSLYYSAGDFLGGGNIQIHTADNGTAKGRRHSKAEQPGETPLAGHGFCQNSPNLFIEPITISFHLPTASYTTLEIYDITGRLLATLVDGKLSAGAYSVTWEKDGAASGIYFCRLTVGDCTATKKLVVLR